MVRRAVFAFALSVAINASHELRTFRPIRCRLVAHKRRRHPVGEPFTVVLTCAVLETDAATVVRRPIAARAVVVQFAPFEVLGGSHGRRSAHRSAADFFQYEYRLRLIAEKPVRQDVALPETSSATACQSKVGQKTSIQGRDQAYVLPAESLRVMSLVPADASDIRDAPAETFGDIDQRAFRANLFSVIGTGAVRARRPAGAARRGTPREALSEASAAGDRLITDAAVLRGISRELSAVQRERDRGGWTPELAGRALAALRIAATYAVGRRASLMPAKPLAWTPRSTPIRIPNRNPAILNPQSVEPGPPDSPGRLAARQSGSPSRARSRRRTVARELSRAEGNARRTELLGIAGAGAHRLHDGAFRPAMARWTMAP